jgi:hypothetical protein
MIEDRLRALAADAFPPTPKLWAGISVAITENPAHDRRRGRRRWLLAALVALFVPATALAVRALWPEHITIVRVQTLPAPAPRTPDLGEQVPTIAEASARAGFPVQTLGAPNHTYVLGNIVTLTYPDVVVTEAPARDEGDVLIKRVGPGTTVEHVPDGYFLSGAPHVVSYIAPDNSYQELPPRVAGNTLAIERDGLVIRIEGKNLTRATALRLSRRLAAP